MKPVLYAWGNSSVSSHFFMAFVAVALSAFFFYSFGRREKLKSQVLVDLILIGVVSGLIGAKFFHVISHFDRYQFLFEAGLFDLLLRRGYISYGAIFGITLGALIYLKMRGERAGPYMDVAALTAPIIIFCFRLGCLLSGCCFGKPTDFFIHLTFLDPISSAGKSYPGLPLHATQVYGMVKACLIFGVLWWRYGKRRFDGEIILLFFILYAFLRFIVEFLRGDPGRSTFFGGTLNSAQVFMLPLFVVSLSLYYTVLHGSIARSPKGIA